MTNPSANVFERMAQDPDCAAALRKLSMKDLYAVVRVAREEPMAVLQSLMADPHGCPFCDYGTLRNPAKEHDADCPYLRASTLPNTQKEGT